MEEVYAAQKKWVLHFILAIFSAYFWHRRAEQGEKEVK